MLLVSDYNFYLTKDNTCRYIGSRDKNDIARLKREWKKHGVILNDDLSVPPEQKAIIDRVSRDTRLFFYEDFKFCFERKLVDGEVVYEAPKEYKNYSNRVQDLKSYYQKNGIEVDINPENGRLRIHPNSVKKYEAHLSSTLDSLKLDQFKLNDQGVLEADFDEEFCKKMSAKYRSVGLYVDYRHKGGKAELVHAEHIDCIDELTGGYFKLREKIPHYKNNGLISSARLSKEASNVGISINVEDVTDNLVIPKIREAHAIELEKQLLEMGYSSDNIKIKDINDGYGYKKVIVFGEEKKLVDDIFPLFRNQAGKIVINKDKCVCLQKSESMIKYTPRYTIVGEGVDTMDSDTLKGLRNRAIRAGIDPQDIQLVLDADGINSRSCLIFLNEDKTDDFLRKELSSDGRQLLHKLDPQDLETPDELKQYLSQKDAPDFDANDGVELSVKREGIHVAQNMDTVSRIDTSDLLTDTPEGRVDMNRETSASPNASGVDVNHIQVSSPNNRGAKLASLGTKAMTTLEVLGVMGDVAGAAIDPQGTAEFHDDLLHGRFEKILIDLEKGFNVIETQPFSETYNQFKKSLSDAIAENYEGAETMGDYASKTGENILGVVAATAGSILDAGTALVNKGYESFDSDTRVVRHNVSVKDAKSDPVTYLKDRVQSETVNIKMGVRSDDTYFSIIERNDARAMMNYINHLPGQWYGIQSRIHLEYVFNQEDGSKKHIKTTQTPVVYAAFNHRYDMVGLLTGDLRMYDYVYDTDKDTQQTPLMHLLDCMPSPYSYFSKDREKHKQPIALLLKHQTCTIENLNKVDKWGNSAFLYASKCSDSAIIASLMKKGVNIAQKNNMGENALHLYQGSDYKIIATLVQAGVDMDAKDKNGMTPLMKQLSMYISNPTPEAKMRLNAFLICVHEKQLNDLCLNQNMALQLGNVLSAQPEMMRVFKQYHPKVISTLHLDEMDRDENQEVPLNAPDGVVVSLKEKEGTMQTQEQPHLDERLVNNSSIVKEGPQNGIIEQQKTAERV